MVAGGIPTVPVHISCLCGHYSKQMFDSIPFDDLEMLNSEGCEGHGDGTSQSPCGTPAFQSLFPTLLRLAQFS